MVISCLSSVQAGVDYFFTHWAEATFYFLLRNLTTKAVLITLLILLVLMILTIRGLFLFLRYSICFLLDFVKYATGNCEETIYPESNI